IVFFDRIWTNPQVSKVTVDDYEGAFTATKHLLAIGCKRIAHIAGPSNLQVTQNRLEGYLAALRQSNLSIDQELIIDGGFSRDFGRQATQQLLALPQKPDAIFCVNDRSAIGCILTLKEQQIAIPAEIAVIGFTNSETATIVSPTLSTMAQPTLALGRLSMHLMLKHLNQEDFIPEHQVLKTNLIVRQSTDKHPKS
ncbi:MAG: substrate-binding domain-containing protein, partial [Bacteroidota bacterium]